MHHQPSRGRRAVAGVAFATLALAGIAVPAASAAPHVALSASVSTQAPKVTTQPKSVTVASGKKATFVVKASGAHLTYRWYASSDGKKWAKISHATSPSYKVTAKASLNGHAYRVVVSNTHGKVTSKSVHLTVAVTPHVTSQPRSTTVVSGKKATFAVKATGNALSYQWYAEAPGKSWAKIGGATRSSYALTTSASKDGYKYQVRMANKAGHATSSAAKLTVVTKPKITVADADLLPFAENGDPVTLRVSATGGALSYQWRRVTYFDNGTSEHDDIPGATRSTLAITSASTADAGDYEVVVKNAAGSAVSDDISLYVTSTWQDPFQPGQIALFNDWALRLDPFRLSASLDGQDGTSTVTTYFEGQTADGDDAGHARDLQFQFLAAGAPVGEQEVLGLYESEAGPVGMATVSGVASVNVDGGVWKITDTSDPAEPIVEYFSVGRVDHY